MTSKLNIAELVLFLMGCSMAFASLVGLITYKVMEYTHREDKTTTNSAGQR